MLLSLLTVQGVPGPRLAFPYFELAHRDDFTTYKALKGSALEDKLLELDVLADQLDVRLVSPTRCEAF